MTITIRYESYFLAALREQPALGFDHEKATDALTFMFGVYKQGKDRGFLRISHQKSGDFSALFSTQAPLGYVSMAGKVSGVMPNFASCASERWFSRTRVLIAKSAGTSPGSAKRMLY